MWTRTVAVAAILAFFAGIVVAQQPLPASNSGPQAPNQPIKNAFKMEGDVKDAGGTPIFGATVATAGKFSAKTDRNGHFVFPALPRGSVYIVKATLSGYTFQPANQPVNAPAQGDVNDVKFTGTKLPPKK
jgi:hypothetical protein